MHVMIDMETFGTKPDAAVATVGVVVFDPKTQTVDTDNGVEWALSIPDQIRLGRKIDPSTVAWWMNQSEDARKVVIPPLNGKGMSVEGFCDSFDAWLVDRGASPKNPIKIWSHGATFDIVLGTSLYNNIDREPKWRYVNARDTRTIFEMFNPTPVKYGVAHKALDDAIKQAMMVNECYQLREGKGSEGTAKPIVNDLSKRLPPVMTREQFAQHVR
jgi:hypothetical protein